MNPGNSIFHPPRERRVGERADAVLSRKKKALAFFATEEEGNSKIVRPKKREKKS